MAKRHSNESIADETPKFRTHAASGQIVLKRKGRVYYFGKDEAAAKTHYHMCRTMIATGQPIPSINE